MKGRVRVRLRVRVGATVQVRVRVRVRVRGYRAARVAHAENEHGLGRDEARDLRPPGWGQGWGQGWG